MEPIPNLRQAIHRVLRHWSQPGHDRQPWDQMLIVAQHKRQQPSPNHDLVVKQVVEEALDKLAAQSKGTQAQVLRLRFQDGLTAREVAAQQNLTINIVHKQQRKGLENLAAIVQQMEQEALAQHRDRILERLECPTLPLLFGVNDKLADLQTRLTNGSSPWIVAVTGMGGIGKTSLACAAVHEIADASTFADIAWVSAKQDRLTPWYGLEENPDGRPALTFEGLLEAIIEQFDLQDLSRLPPGQQRQAIKTRLQEQPYLIVVDNLETVADYQALIPELHPLTNPSKFLLTGRRNLHRYPRVHSLELDELSEGDSLALLRHEAAEQGLSEIAHAPTQDLLAVYQTAGGNPLALKLLVGQMHLLSPTEVVENLRQAQGEQVHDLYRYIYRRSWDLLDDDAQQVLAIMPLVAESGGGLDQIAALSELPRERMLAALEQLVTLCLVNVRGTVQARRYGIHRLTEAFLLNEVHTWQAEAP